MKITHIVCRVLRMKNVPAKTLLVLGTLAGCEPEPPPPKSGIEIKAPGVDIKIDKSGTDVKAPGTDVKVDKDGVDIKSPGAGVKVNGQ